MTKLNTLLEIKILLKSCKKEVQILKKFAKTRAEHEDEYQLWMLTATIYQRLIEELESVIKQ